jgi:actin-like ATPase involved in cell morphogenesis
LPSWSSCPGSNRIDVHVNGELLFAKSMLGRYPQPGAVVRPLREYFAAG